MQAATKFASLDSYEKGWVQVINDDPKHYVFSNIFEVAAVSAPYEKVVVAKNLEYVMEVLRAEGASPWFAAGHDEFVIVMDGEVEVEFVELRAPQALVPPDKEGSVQVPGEAPDGQPMGYIRAGRGHQVLLPQGAAYRFKAARPGVLLMQTILGELSRQKWAEICAQ
jgi:hypothetical protein